MSFFYDEPGSVSMDGSNGVRTAHVGLGVQG